MAGTLDLLFVVVCFDSWPSCFLQARMSLCIKQYNLLLLTGSDVLQLLQAKQYVAWKCCVLLQLFHIRSHWSVSWQPVLSNSEPRRDTCWMSVCRSASSCWALAPCYYTYPHVLISLLHGVLCAYQQDLLNVGTSNVIGCIKKSYSLSGLARTWVLSSWYKHITSVCKKPLWPT